MRDLFQEQLNELKRELTVMGASCEEIIALASQALTGWDGILAQKVNTIGGQIDESERTIETICMKLLLRQQPVARDLRTISTAMKMVTDLQRIGDQAANIAKLSLLMAKQGRARIPDHIGSMSQKAGVMVSQAIAAYTNRDVELAHAVVNLDDEVDDLFAAVKV